MPCRRCSTCGLHLPITLTDCPVCDGKTDYFYTVDPDPDWEHLVELAQATDRSVAGQRTQEWRRLRLAQLGFVGAMLDLLVDAPVDLHTAARLIESGCPAETAARILL